MKQNGENFDFVSHTYTPPATLDRQRPPSWKDRVIFGTFVFLVVSLVSFAAIVLLSLHPVMERCKSHRQPFGERVWHYLQGKSSCFIYNGTAGDIFLKVNLAIGTQVHARGHHQERAGI